MTDSAEDVDSQPHIFTTSFSGLRVVQTNQKTWSGFAWGATHERMVWDEQEMAWRVGNSILSFGRTFRLFSRSGEAEQIVFVGDATGMGR